jgi:hypothetical protein
MSPRSADLTAILVDEAGEHVQAEPPADGGGLLQIGLGQGELLPVTVHQATVGEHPQCPQVIAGAAQDRQGPLIDGQRLVEPAELVHDRAALHLGPGAGPGMVPQVGQGGVDLAQRGSRPAPAVQHERHGHPGLAGQQR